MQPIKEVVHRVFVKITTKAENSSKVAEENNAATGGVFRTFANIFMHATLERPKTTIFTVLNLTFGKGLIPGLFVLLRWFNRFVGLPHLMSLHRNPKISSESCYSAHKMHLLA